MLTVGVRPQVAAQAHLPFHGNFGMFDVRIPAGFVSSQIEVSFYEPEKSHVGLYAFCFLCTEWLGWEEYFIPQVSFCL